MLLTITRFVRALWAFLANQWDFYIGFGAPLSSSLTSESIGYSLHRAFLYFFPIFSVIARTCYDVTAVASKGFFPTAPEAVFR